MIDLDGTLLDTAEDLALSANLMLKDLNMPEQSTATIRSYIGKGIQKLVKRTLTGQLDGEPDAALFAKALPIYEKHYANNLSRNTRPYPGVVEGMEALQQAGFSWPASPIKRKHSHSRCCAPPDCSTISRSFCLATAYRRKNRIRMPLTHICKHFNVQPHEALLIGDSLNDAIAARAAGCHVFCVTYGYNEGRNVYELDCDAIVETLIEASKLISK
jgi:phosphoglycolate phosphatase